MGRFIILIVAQLAFVTDGIAKCMPSVETRAIVSVQSCVSTTLRSSGLSAEFRKGEYSPLYSPGSEFTGTLLAVTVQSSVELPGSASPSDKYHRGLWKRGADLTLFLAEPAEAACPAHFGDKLTIDTNPLCCDVAPWSGICLLPRTVVYARRVTG